MGLGHREASGNGTPCRGSERKPDEPPRANRNARQQDSRDAKQPELLRGPEVRTGGPRDTSDNRNNLTKKKLAVLPSPPVPASAHAPCVPRDPYPRARAGTHVVPVSAPS